jgi:uncharacterized protein YnzC (UPF0291/DUF896 family)
MKANSKWIGFAIVTYVILATNQLEASSRLNQLIDRAKQQKLSASQQSEMKILLKTNDLAAKRKLDTLFSEMDLILFKLRKLE